MDKRVVEFRDDFLKVHSVIPARSLFASTLKQAFPLRIDIPYMVTGEIPGKQLSEVDALVHHVPMDMLHDNQSTGCCT